MLVDILEVKPLAYHRLWVKFEDDVEGELPISDLISFTGVFAPLRDEEFFKQVAVEYGTVTWANGADLDPVVLYSHVTGKSIPEYKLSNANSN